MSLPNQDMEFTALTALPASELNKLVENIESLSDGSGIDEDANFSIATLSTTGAISTDTFSEKTAGNGVVVDGFAVKDGVPKNWNGWITPDETWTYASASTFTVTGDVTTKYTKGTRLKWTQTTVRYGVVVGSSYSAPNTTVTIAVNTNHVIDNAAITLNYYSYAANPQGYPKWFNYTPTLTNLSGGTINIARFNITSDVMLTEFKYTLAGAGVAGTIGVSTAAAMSNSTTADYLGTGKMVVGGASFFGALRASDANTIGMLVYRADLAYMSQANLSTTVPGTWASGDTIHFYVTCGV